MEAEVADASPGTDVRRQGDDNAHAGISGFRDRLLPTNALRSLDREHPAPNASVVDHNNGLWQVLGGNGHQDAAHTLQAFGFAVVATSEQDQARAVRSGQREEPGEIQVGRNHNTLFTECY